MGVVIKQSFWGTVITYIGVLVGYVNALYARAEYFDLSQIGIFTLVTASAMMVSPVSSFGMASSFIRYFPSFEEKDRNKFFTFLILITLVGNALILFIGYLFKDIIASRYIESAPEFISYLPIIGIIIISNSFFELFFSYSKMVMKVVFPSFLREVYLRACSLLLVIGVAFEWWNFDTAIIGLGITYLFAFVFLFLQLILFHRFRFDFDFSLIDKKWRMNLVKFGTYAMFLAASFAIINNVTYDQITAALGSDINGIYNTCFYIAVIVEMPRRNMAKVLTPIFSEEFEKRNFKEVNRLYKRGSITMSVIGLLLFIGIATNLQDLFNFIPNGEKFQAGFWVVIGVCSAKFAVMVFSFAGEIINFSKLYKYNLYMQVVAMILLITLNYVMIPIWGMNGAVISYFAVIFLHHGAKTAFVMHHFKLHPFIKTHGHLLVIGLLVSAFALWFDSGLHPVLNIGIRSILTTIIFVFLVYRFNVSEDINNLINASLKMVGIRKA